MRPRLVPSVALLAAVAVLGTAAPTAAASAPVGPADDVPTAVAGQPVTAGSQQLAPGVELLTMSWGATGPDDRWSVLVYLPSDPDAGLDTGSTALGPRATAERAAEALREAGHTPYVAAVDTPEFADAEARRLGWTVKVGSFETDAEARSLLTELRADGFQGGVRYTAQDGADRDAPQQARVLRVDPDEYGGELVAEHGATLNGTEPLTELVGTSGALAGVNAQWFYSGAPAGLYVKDGEVLGSATRGRGGVLVRDGGEHLEVDSFTARTWLRVRGERIELDGVNRMPGRIQNCGGLGGDLPTEQPQHDLVCTDDSELIRFTPQWGQAPSGEGAEAVLDARGRVLEVNPSRGAAVPDGGSTIQATGDSADLLREHVDVGDRVRIRNEVRDRRGKRVELTRDTTIMQVGPTLVEDGEVSVHAQADGLFREGVDQTFTYNWVLRANPRSAIGVDERGRLLLVVVDGRQATYSEGLSVLDHARFLHGLGAVEALNLDGGGSSVMVTGEEGIVNRPSDATGERSLGNAFVLTSAD